MTDAQFMQLVLIPEAGTIGGKLNLERLTLTPLFTIDDQFFFDVLGDRINSVTGLLDDPTPPFKLSRIRRWLFYANRSPRDVVPSY